MVKKYIPEQGDIIWLQFDPQQGREIQKTRPALTISPSIYNAKTGLGLFMPITSQIKGYPFEIIVQDQKSKLNGAILCDHIRSLNWQARQAKFISKVSKSILEEAMSKFSLLIKIK